MSEFSAAELEREAEKARERVSDTADAIKRKLTAGQLIDEFSNMFSGGDLSQGLGNLKHQVRDNPMPMLLVGAGLAWLAFGNTAAQALSQAVTSATGSPSSAPRSGTSAYRAPSTGSSSSTSTGGSSMMSNLADGAMETARSVGDTVSDATETFRDTAGQLQDSMVSHASEASTKIRDTATDLMGREPLMLGVAGLLVGTAIGALLPATEIEKQQFGAQAAKLKADAMSLVDSGVQGAEKVASSAYDALKEEADNQGLTRNDGKPLGERIGEVVQSAADSAQSAVRKELGTQESAS